jgi:hypothetical protein
MRASPFRRAGGGLDRHGLCRIDPLDARDRNRHGNLELGRVHDAQDRVVRIACHDVTRLVPHLRDDAGEAGAHDGAVLLRLCGLEEVVRLAERCFGRGQRRLAFVEFVAGNESAIVQRVQPRDFAAGGFDARRRLSDLELSRPQFNGDARNLQFHEDVAGLDGRGLALRDLDDFRGLPTRSRSDPRRRTARSCPAPTARRANSARARAGP